MAFPLVLPQHQGRRATRGTIAMLLPDEKQDYNIVHDNKNNHSNTVNRVWRMSVPPTKSVLLGGHDERQQQQYQQQQQQQQKDATWMKLPPHNSWRDENKTIQSHEYQNRNYNNYQDNHVTSSLTINHQKNTSDNQKVNGQTIMLQDSIRSTRGIPEALERCFALGGFPCWTQYSPTMMKQDNHTVQEVNHGITTATTTTTPTMMPTANMAYSTSNKRDREHFERHTTATDTSQYDAFHRYATKRFHDNGSSRSFFIDTTPVR